MSYEEIIKLLTNPDKLTEGLTALDEYNRTLTGERDTLKEQNESSNARIKQLQEDKINLYMRITGDAPVAEEDTRNDFEKLMDKVKEGNK